MDLNIEETYLKFVPVVVLVIAGAFVLNGVKMFESSAECTTDTVKCHGVPVNDQCYGYNSYTTSFVDSSKCNVTSIEQRCNRLGERVCEENQKSIGTQWTSLAEVQGKKCSTWDREYSLDLKSC